MIETDNSLIDKMLESLNNINDTLSQINRPTIILVGRNATFNKGWTFINTLISKMPGTTWLGISETPRLTEENVKEAIHVDPVLIPIRMPMYDMYEKNLDVNLPKYVRRDINKKKYIKEAIKNIEYHIYNMSKSYAKLLCWYLYKFHETVINSLEKRSVPFAFVMWGEGPPSHYILKNMCKEKSTPYWFMELGTLSGTMLIEPEGQVGKSCIALNPTEFKNIQVDKKDIEKTEKIIEYMHKTGMNRNVQYDSTAAIEKLKKRLLPNAPTIAYYMMDDFECSIIPYTKDAKKYRSPIFKSSIDAAKYMVKVAKKNGWNLIIKPHPIIRKAQVKKWSYDDDNIIWVEDINVNNLMDLSDLTVTIFSQISYESIIRDRPVVLLGYNQMKGQGCTYQCDSLHSIEPTIKKALKEGYTLEQKQCFKEFFSKMCSSYYLFDNLEEREYRWGRSMDECVKMLTQSLETKKDSD